MLLLGTVHGVAFEILADADEGVSDALSAGRSSALHFRCHKMLFQILQQLGVDGQQLFHVGKNEIDVLLVHQLFLVADPQQVGVDNDVQIPHIVSLRQNDLVDDVGSLVLGKWWRHSRQIAPRWRRSQTAGS